MIEPVARELWGEPNNQLSSKTELRWGSHGARMVRLDKGTWADHEGGHTSINAGGVLDLIGREKGLDHKGAFGWLREHGYDVDDDRRRPASNGHDKAAPLGKEVAHYDYADEADALIFQVVRFEPKTFRQRRRPQPGDDPAKSYNGWVYSARGVRQVPSSVRIDRGNCARSYRLHRRRRKGRRQPHQAGRAGNLQCRWRWQVAL
jgi:hypothetical protein